MKFLYSDDPIIACSTNNNSNCAIAIIRLSGFQDLEILKEFLSIDPKSIKPRYAHFCKIQYQDVIYDEVVATFFKGPNSYNGENILELSVHGNTFNVDRIISLFIDFCGFRNAYPGEFSYRALKNNKLSLSQIEGLDLLLNANSNFSLQQGFSLLNGKLQNNYMDLQRKFIAHKSAVELSIDFLEDMGEEAAKSQFDETFKQLFNQVKKLKDHADNTGLNLINPEVTLVGLPNAGKSSLFNILLDDNRAIVSDIAGTTRDYLAENIKIGDVLCRLIDTAGIRTTDDNIESQGIQKSLDLLETSFFKILLINPFEFNIDFFKAVKSVNFDLIIFTHTDNENFKAASNTVIAELDKINWQINGPIEPVISGPIGAGKSGPIEPKNLGPMGADKSGPIEPLNLGPIGASLIDNASEVSTFLRTSVNNKYLSLIQNDPILIDRHQEVINKLYLDLCNFKQLCSIESDISIISSELNSIGHCISELIGIVSPDDVLHNIFNNFCIGK